MRHLRERLTTGLRENACECRSDKSANLTVNICRIQDSHMQLLVPLTLNLLAVAVCTVASTAPSFTFPLS